MMRDAIQKIQQQLSEKVGKEYCYFDASQLKSYHYSLTHSQREILGVVKPTSIAQIQHVLLIANELHFAVYPISQGNNWGYGEKLPAQNNNLILDLSLLNAITAYNSEAGYVKVQPGVTQQQLYDYLQEHGGQHMVPVTGIGPFGSILGNALERGYGITPYGDHAGAITEMKVMLANGEIVQTGLSRLGAEKSGAVYRWGVGPYLDGMFVQGNLGIVLEITIVLKRMPSSIKTVFFTLKDSSQLPTTFLSLKELIENQVIGTGVSLFSALRMLSVNQRFPYQELQTSGMHKNEVLKKMIDDEGIPAWSGFFGLYGDKKQIKMLTSLVKKILKPHTSQLIIYSQSMLEKLVKLSAILKIKKIKQLCENAQIVSNLMHGKPMKNGLAQAFWRSKKPLDMSQLLSAKDITSGDNGLIWFAPIIPYTKGDFENITKITQPIFESYGFEYVFGCALMSAHYIEVTLPILFNKTIEGETEKANACYRALFDACLNEGYLPYRLNINAMPLIHHSSNAYDELARKIKEVVDPGKILSPGRYVD